MGVIFKPIENITENRNYKTEPKEILKLKTVNKFKNFIRCHSSSSA